MALTAAQKQLLRRVLAVGERMGASPKERKAAVETALVESGARNLPGGDADSAGWRQERASLYPDPTNVENSAKRFFRETRAVKGKYGRAGDLAAAVQRPAARYRGRYQQRSADADAILRELGVGATDRMRPAKSTGSSRVITTPGVDNSPARRQMLAQYLLQRDQPAALVSLGLGLKEAQDVPGTSRTVTSHTATPAPGGGGAPSRGGAALTAKMKAAADRIDAQKLAYKWGGGHAGKVKPGAGIPLDCSGAVSSVLGINPRVSGQFEKFGSPGRAPGGRGVTIYANSGHVLMEIDGRYWGTSKDNPGGGAGWIERSKISPQYLKGFTARHLARTTR